MLCTIRNKCCVRQSLLLAHADVARSGALSAVAGDDTHAIAGGVEPEQEWYPVTGAATGHEWEIDARHTDHPESRPRPRDPRGRGGVGRTSALAGAHRAHWHRQKQRLPAGEHAASAPLPVQPE